MSCDGVSFVENSYNFMAGQNVDGFLSLRRKNAFVAYSMRMHMHIDACASTTVWMHVYVKYSNGIISI